MNYIHITGRLGADPEIIPYKKQNISTGEDRRERFLAKFDIAVDPPWRPGQDKDAKPDWIPIVAFDGPAAGFAQKALKKGDAVCLTGRLQTDIWETEDGGKRKSLHVTVIEIEKSSPATPSEDAASRVLEEV